MVTVAEVVAVLPSDDGPGWDGAMEAVLAGLALMAGNLASSQASCSWVNGEGGSSFAILAMSLSKALNRLNISSGTRL